MFLKPAEVHMLKGTKVSFLIFVNGFSVVAHIVTVNNTIV